MSAREFTTVEHVRQVVPPGRSFSYTELIERLTGDGLPTAGVGLIVKAFSEEEYNNPGSRAEFRVWMKERFWDDEVEGGWNKCELWIIRKPDEVPAED